MGATLGLRVGDRRGDATGLGAGGRTGAGVLLVGCSHWKQSLPALVSQLRMPEHGNKVGDSPEGRPATQQ